MEVKNMQSNNPLSKHFRHPTIFLKLPSNGKYWPPGSIMLTATGELGVMPMTAKDEIMLRTPDALMNGQGVVSVIESCIPEIKNAWAMPTIDSDAILIAIRIATYGQNMDMDSNCPNCQHDNRHQLDLNTILLNNRSPDYSKTIEVEGLIFKFKPLSYIQSTKNNIANFEQQKIMQLLMDDNLDAETRKAQFDIHLQKIIDSNINILTFSTESITSESGEVVTDKEFIAEFYANANNGTIKTIQESMQKILDSVKMPSPRVQCEECSTEYNLEVAFDYANFFEPLS